MDVDAVEVVNEYVTQVNFHVKIGEFEFSTIGSDGQNNLKWRVETRWEDDTNTFMLVKMYLLQKKDLPKVQYKVNKANNVTMIDWTNLEGSDFEFEIRVPIAIKESDRYNGDRYYVPIAKEKRERYIMLKIVTKGESIKEASLANNLDFLNNKDFSDVVIQCGDKSFDCHKVILASHSPVFKAMLTSNMKEKNNNEIQIDDIEPEVMTEFLEFIYTGKSSNLDKFAMRLFIAADKYQIISLKETCEKILISSLGIDNCLSLLILGDKCSPAIKKSALKFMIKNKGNINFGENFVNHPSLMLEVLKEDFGKGTKQKLN